MCGIIGIYRHDGNVNVEVYEGLLMLQHRGQDSAGMVTTVSVRGWCGLQWAHGSQCGAREV